jgi:hypothetical protein
MREMSNVRAEGLNYYPRIWLTKFAFGRLKRKRETHREWKRQREGQIERERDWERGDREGTERRDRQTDRQTDRHTDRQQERERQTPGACTIKLITAVMYGFS